MLTRAKKARYAAAIFAVCLIWVAFLGAYSGSSQRARAPESDQATNQANTKSESRSYIDDLWDWATRDAITVYTLCLASFTGALVGVSWVQIRYLRRADETARIAANSAKESAETARQTLIFSHRAWVRVRVNVGSYPLTFNKDGAEFGVSLEFTNTGNAPALKITHRLWLLSQKSGFLPVKRQEELCESVRRKTPGIATTLFPDETFPSNVGLGQMHYNARITRAEIDEGLAFDPSRKQFRLLVVGCVNYTFPSDPQGCHQTRYMFDVRKVLNFGLVTADQNLLPPEILLMESMGGAGRYAD